MFKTYLAQNKFLTKDVQSLLTKDKNFSVRIKLKNNPAILKEIADVLRHDNKIRLKKLFSNFSV